MTEQGIGERSTARAWRAVVIEDHPDFASAVRELVEADGTTVVEAVCHTLALGTDLVRRLRPELILTDFRLPDGDAVEHFPVWHDASPESRILVTSAWTDDRSVRRAREGGAAAYIDKTTDLLELPSLIADVMRGVGWACSAWMATSSARGERTRVTSPSDRDGTRSERVLAGVLAELSTADIARAAGLDEHQVRHEVNDLLRRAGVRTRAELRRVHDDTAERRADH